MTMPPELAETLELLRLPHERTLANAKARLALRINYNAQSIHHWCSGNRPMGPYAREAVRVLRDTIRMEHGGGNG